MSRLVSKEWKELSDSKKAQYQRIAEKEQEKHRVAKQNWEAKQSLALGGHEGAGSLVSGSLAGGNLGGSLVGGNLGGNLVVMTGVEVAVA